MAAKDEDARSVTWLETGALRMLDQRILPHRVEYIDYATAGEVVQAIKDMVVRGAPAIGAAGAYGLVLAARAIPTTDVELYKAEVAKERDILFASRPTAVNLKWGLERLMAVVQTAAATATTAEINEALLKEAHAIAEDDIRINKTMADFGASLVPANGKILHHCNTGAIATVGWGTALGVIHTAHNQGKNVHVWVDETRPRLQGARLTAWELMQWGVPFKLIPDNAAGLLMLRKQVDIVLVGADRVAANGDTANKIGTYKLAACAKDNNVPFYIVAPISTVDLTTLTGDDIPIEERDPREVTHIGEEAIAPEGCPVFNPAFDVTPARLITGIVTERGIALPPFTESLRKLVEQQ